jgi:hypothetical protein
LFGLQEREFDQGVEGFLGQEDGDEVEAEFFALF